MTQDKNTLYLQYCFLLSLHIYHHNTYNYKEHSQTRHNHCHSNFNILCNIQTNNFISSQYNGLCNYTKWPQTVCAEQLWSFPFDMESYQLTFPLKTTLFQTFTIKSFQKHSTQMLRGKNADPFFNNNFLVFSYLLHFCVSFLFLVAEPSLFLSASHCFK